MKSIANLAEQLGVTPAIIRSWQINLNLDHPRYSPDEPVYNADWQSFFEEVARLRKQGQSFSKIRSALAAQMPASSALPPAGNGHSEKPPGNGNGAKPAEAPPPAEPAAQLNFSFNSREPRSYAPEENTQALVRVNSEAQLPSVQHLQNNMHEALIHQDLTKMAQTYVQLMENYQSLATRYSESAYVLGQLEEKNKALETLMHEKESHFQDKEQAQMQRIQELEAHLGNLRHSLERRETDLSRSQDSLATKDEISQVEKQLKMLAVTVFQQQEELARSQPPGGFWSKLRQRLFGS